MDIGRTQTRKSPEKLITRLVGVLHNGAQDNLRKYKKGPLQLIFERNNPYHSKAVKVVANGSEHLGYLPREDAEIVVDRWDQERIPYLIVWARKVENPEHENLGMRLVLEAVRTGRSG